jgi:hypothetical protein
MSNLENIDNNAAQHENNNDGPPPPQHVQPHLLHHIPPQQNNNDPPRPQITTSTFWSSPLTLDETLDETLERCIINNMAIGEFPIPHWRNLNPNPNDKREMERERVLPTFEELRNIQGPDRPARLRPQ